jgi:hypothetical protein
VFARQVIDRLMRLDAVVLQPELIWLATEEKVALFSLMAPSFARERLPHIAVGTGRDVGCGRFRTTNQSVLRSRVVWCSRTQVVAGRRP